LVHVADAGSLSRGAERSHLSTPAASLRIKNLEIWLGARIFHRQAQGLVPTWIGVNFVQRARQIIREADELQTALIGYTQGHTGVIRLSATSAAISEFLPEALGRYLRQRPDIQIQVTEALSADTVAALIADDVDIGVISDNVPTPGLEIRPFRADPLVLVTSARHELRRLERACARELLDHDFVMLPLAGRIHRFLSEEASANGRSLRIKLEVKSAAVACRMVEADVGIAILPLSSAQRHARSLAIRLVPLVDAWANHSLRICAKKFDWLPAHALEFVDTLIDVACRPEQSTEENAA
jgi:DNA-binding transcriptional LysR family regulator